MVNLAIAFGVFALVILAEWLHAKRIARAKYLAFGAAGRARRWTIVAPWARGLACAALAWGLLTLLRLDGAPVVVNTSEKPKRHLLLCLDVSPSMDLKDAGGDGKLARDTRARQVLRSMMERLDLATTRVSVVAFYTTAKPVVIDTWDLNVVSNILDGLPLEYAFKEGPTAMYSGVREAAALSAKWAKNSTTLVVISDGDTLPEVDAPRLPESISSVLVLGVGNPHRGTQIAGRSSKQDSSALKSLAARLKGTYFDANAHHLPTSLVNTMWLRGDKGERFIGEKTYALIAVGVGSGVIALLWPLLAAWGTPAASSAGSSSRKRAVSAAGSNHADDRGTRRVEATTSARNTNNSAGSLQGAGT